MNGRVIKKKEEEEENKQVIMMGSLSLFCFFRVEILTKQREKDTRGMRSFLVLYVCNYTYIFIQVCGIGVVEYQFWAVGRRTYIQIDHSGRERKILFA